MNEFMNTWQPIVKADSEMELKLDSHGTETGVNCSEGDTLFIRQYKKNTFQSPQYVSIGREELYNIILNFMNPDELAYLLGKLSADEKWKQF